MSTTIRLVLVHVRKAHEPDKMPTNKDVANYLDPKVTGEWADTWTIEGVTSPTLDVETLASLVDDAELSGEDIVKLLGEITGRSLQRSLRKLADGLEGKAEELRNAEANPR